MRCRDEYLLIRTHPVIILTEPLGASLTQQPVFGEGIINCMTEKPYMWLMSFLRLSPDSFLFSVSAFYCKVKTQFFIVQP